MATAAVLDILVRSQGISSVSRQLTTVDKTLAQTAGTASRATRDIEDIGKRGSKSLGLMKGALGTLAGVAVFDTLRRGIGAAVGEFEEARKVSALTENVIKSTGGAANITAKQVGNLASSISRKVGIDDEAIQSGANLLLTFKNIRNETGRGRDIFNQATAAAVDLSAAGFGSVESASKQLGKALNDPIKGMTALGRSGVTFSEDQKSAIAALIETGKASDRVAAQQIILREVQSQVGGAAAAQATALDHLKVFMGNAAETAGGILVPAFDALARGVVAVGGAIGDIIGFFRRHETVTMALGAAIGVLAAAYVGSLIPGLVTGAVMVGRQIAVWIAWNAVLLANPIGLVIAAVAALTAVLVIAYKESETFRRIVDGAWSALRNVASSVFPAIRNLIVGAWNTIRTVTTSVWSAISASLSAAWGAIRAAAGLAWEAVRVAVLNPVREARDTLSEVWGSVSSRASAAWASLRSAADTAWEAVSSQITGPVRAARDTISDVWAQIRSRADTAWEGLKSAAGGFANGIKDTIVDAFRGAANSVLGFVNSIIGVINKIPGVNIAAVKGLAVGGTLDATNGVQYLANGGKVNKPMAIVGEEAPRHPEYVIPTNPAYRGRALGLFSQLGADLGFDRERLALYAKGGVLGDRKGGPLDVLGDILSAPAALLEKGASFILDQLPNPSDLLPSWLHGMGSSLISSVTKFVKDKVGDLFGGGDAPLGSAAGGLGLATSLAARFGNVVTSGYRPGDPGWHGKGRARDYAGGDMLGFAKAAVAAFGARALEIIHTPLGYGIKNGQRVAPYAAADHYDHVHVALAKGGILPFVGSYKGGGTVPQDGMAYVHKGETVTPADRSDGPLVHIENMNVASDFDADAWASRLAFRLAV